MMFQGVGEAAEVGDVKMEVAHGVSSSDLAAREACLCLFVKFAKEVRLVTDSVSHQFVTVRTIFMLIKKVKASHT